MFPNFKITFIFSWELFYGFCSCSRSLFLGGWGCGCAHSMRNFPGQGLSPCTAVTTPDPSPAEPPGNSVSFHSSVDYPCEPSAPVTLVSCGSLSTAHTLYSCGLDYAVAKDCCSSLIFCNTWHPSLWMDGSMSIVFFPSLNSYCSNSPSIITFFPLLSTWT